MVAVETNKTASGFKVLKVQKTLIIFAKYLVNRMNAVRSRGEGRLWRIVLLKVAYYIMLLAVLEILPNYAKIMPEFPNYAPDFRNYAHKMT